MGNSPSSARSRVGYAVLSLSLAFVLSACGSASAPQAEAPPAPSGGGFTVEPAEIYTLSEVAKHAVVGDCWLAIAGQVYDVSSFTTAHPGGEAILKGCGQDATQMFSAGHGDKPKPKELLPDFYIGELAK